MLKKILFGLFAYIMVKKYQDGENLYKQQYKQYIDDLNKQAELELEQREQQTTSTSYIPARISYTLSVGCLVGSKASVQLDMYITSLSADTNYTIRNIVPTLFINNRLVQFQPRSNTAYQLKSHGTIKLSWSTNRGFGKKEDVEWIKEFICAEAKKKLITSVSNGWSTNKTEMEVQIEYAAQNIPEYVFNKGIQKNITGKLIYKGEAWYPGNN